MKITFSGAAGGVTGSKHLITTSAGTVLLDCGMYQGHWRESYERNRELPFEASSIDAVVLSHAHIDHSGLLPLLVKKGYDGPIYATPETKELLLPLLADAASIQKEDFMYWSSRAKKDPSITVLEPLFDNDDVTQTLNLIKTFPYKETFTVIGDVRATYYNAGHILGSAQVHLIDGDKSLAFSGDLGPDHRKILFESEPIPSADFFLTEGTYGGRLHEEIGHARDTLAKVITDTHSRRGKLIIPSFALERTQEILYDLHRLYDQKKVPRLPVFLDSPLASAFTEIFEKHADSFDEETHDFFLSKNKNPFAFRRLTHTESIRDSKKLNQYDKPCIIIAGSGMCEAGRIKHHLKHGLTNPRNTVLFVGYQAEHTLGRKIQDGESPVRIFGKDVEVNAHTASIRGYSAHGDQSDLIKNIQQTTGVTQIAVVHADPEQAAALVKKITEDIPHITKVWAAVPDTSAEI